jgi:hypothetical protein
MGNKRDSRTEWEDARNKIARHHVIQPFLAGAVGTNIPWSIVPERKRDQEKGINLAFTILVDMAGSQTVRSFIRKIENNNLTNPPVLAEDVDKVRRIFAYYDEITIDNNTKDTELIRQLAGIKFDSTGKGNLSIDVNDYFERISKIQEVILKHKPLGSLRLINRIRSTSSLYCSDCLLSSVFKTLNVEIQFDYNI